MTTDLRSGDPLSAPARSLAFALAAACALAPQPALAHGPEGHKNLKVLSAEDHQALEKGMKAMAKGLGVKCTACHVKGKFDRDDVPEKEAARRFLASGFGEHDAEKRKAALRALLLALERDEARDEAKVWSAVAGWKKQPAHDHGPGRSPPAPH